MSDLSDSLSDSSITKIRDGNGLEAVHVTLHKKRLNLSYLTNGKLKVESLLIKDVSRISDTKYGISVF